MSNKTPKKICFNFKIFFQISLTNYRRADKSGDSLKQEEEAKGISELVRSQEISEDQGGQENIGGTVCRDG